MTKVLRPLFGKVKSWLRARPVGTRLIFAGALLLGAGWWWGLSWMVGAGVAAILAALLLPERPSSHSTRPPPAPRPRRCGSCVSFDLEEGQRQLSVSPHFPSSLLSPDQMLAPRVEPEGTFEDGFPDVPTADLTREKLEGRAHTWKQYGLCAEHRLLINRYDIPEKIRPEPCDKYRERPAGE